MTQTTNAMVRRASNWPGLLAKFVEDKQACAFDWQTNNCAFFACDWIALLTGIDPAAEYRPRVTSALSAARVLKAAGGVGAIAATECERNGWPEVAPSFARRGDLVFLIDGKRTALGICVGIKSAFCGPVGLVFINTASCASAWRIA